MKKIITILLSLILVFCMSCNVFAGLMGEYTADRDIRELQTSCDKFGVSDYVRKYDDTKTFTWVYYYRDLTHSDGTILPQMVLYNVKVPDKSCIYIDYPPNGNTSYHCLYICSLDDSNKVVKNSSPYVVSSYSIQDGFKENVNFNTTISYKDSDNLVNKGVIDTDVPFFSSYAACEDYLLNDNLDGGSALLLPEGYETDSPSSIFVYKSDTNQYDLTVNWTQMNLIDDIRSNVSLDIQYSINGKSNKLDTVVLDPAYKTKSDNYLTTNVYTYMDGVKLSNYTDYVEFGFTVYNYRLIGSGLKSKMKHCYVYWTNHGVFFNENNLINADEILDVGVNLPTEKEYIENGGIINMDDWYNSGGSEPGSFISGIFSGFGLLDGRFSSFISSTFSYVPDEFWVLIFAAVSCAIVVGLFKLVVK